MWEFGKADHRRDQRLGHGRRALGCRLFTHITIASEKRGVRSA
jgi:hypothetical protein